MSLVYINLVSDHLFLVFFPDVVVSRIRTLTYVHVPICELINMILYTEKDILHMWLTDRRKYLEREDYPRLSSRVFPNMNPSLERVKNHRDVILLAVEDEVANHEWRNVGILKKMELGNERISLSQLPDANEAFFNTLRISPVRPMLHF